MEGRHKGKPVRRRRHDAKVSRERILAAARGLFGEEGYGEVSLRRIAAEVGLDAAMVIRHFGSKDRLFAEAMQRPTLMVALLDDTAEPDFGERLVRYAFGLGETSRELHMLMALLRSAPYKQAASQLPSIADEPIKMLSSVLKGEDARLRGALIYSQLIGLLIMHRIFKDEALCADKEVDHIVARFAPLIQALIDAPQ